MKKRKASKKLFCLLRFLIFLKSNKGVQMDQGFHHQKSTVGCSQNNKGWHGHKERLHGVVCR
jgi:hypothetical protein